MEFNKISAIQNQLNCKKTIHIYIKSHKKSNNEHHLDLCADWIKQSYFAMTGLFFFFQQKKKNIANFFFH